MVLMIAALHARSRLFYTVRQLYHQYMQHLSTFVYACNRGFLAVTLNPLAGAEASILVFPSLSRQPLASADIPAMSDAHPLYSTNLAAARYVSRS
jgi:hypothetical protein